MSETKNFFYIPSAIPGYRKTPRYYLKKIIAPEKPFTWPKTRLRITQQLSFCLRRPFGDVARVSYEGQGQAALGTPLALRAGDIKNSFAIYYVFCVFYQERNRGDALTRLIEMIETASHKPKPRRKTKPSKAAVARRLDSKQRQSKKKTSVKKRAGKTRTREQCLSTGPL